MVTDFMSKEETFLIVLLDVMMQKPDAFEMLKVFWQGQQDDDSEF